MVGWEGLLGLRLPFLVVGATLGSQGQDQEAMGGGVVRPLCSVPAPSGLRFSGKTLVMEQMRIVLRNLSSTR